MRFWFAKARRGDKVGLIPTDEESHALVAKMGDGECVEVKVVRPRSIQWHRMYFGICREIGQNQDPERDEDSIDAELRVLAGHFDVMYVGRHQVRIPKRIAFDKLTADEWSHLWLSLETAIRTRFGDEYLREAA